MSFRFCPSCGGENPAFLEGKRWLCNRCGFEYYHNVATAAGVILDGPMGILFLERSREPRKGKLGLPGGFVDPGESAEEAARRECREEIGWSPPELAFLASFPNRYDYGGVSYNTCDLYFYHRLPVGTEPPSLTLGDGEASAIVFLGPQEWREEAMAFGSLARAIIAYRGLPSIRRGD